MNNAIDAEHKPLAIRDDVPSGALATPLVSPDEAKAAMTQYLELCEAVLDASDYQEFYDSKTKSRKRFKKKSAVKKLQTFFGVEVTVKEWARDEMPDGHFGFRVVASAKARNGRVVEATGACSTIEERFDIQPFDDESESKFAYRQRKALARAYHDVLSTAETRATNRAVMNCIGVGGGEVTADEINRDSRPVKRSDFPAAQRPATKPSAAPEAVSGPARPIPEAQAAEGLEKARREVVIFANKRGVSDVERHELTMALFGKPSTKDLPTIDDCRKLYLALVRWVKARDEGRGFPMYIEALVKEAQDGCGSASSKTGASERNTV